jgi:hypothetical protein
MPHGAANVAAVATTHCMPCFQSLPTCTCLAWHHLIHCSASYSTTPSAPVGACCYSLGQGSSGTHCAIPPQPLIPFITAHRISLLQGQVEPGPNSTCLWASAGGAPPYDGGTRESAAHPPPWVRQQHTPGPWAEGGVEPDGQRVRVEAGSSRVQVRDCSQCS